MLNWHGKCEREMQYDHKKQKMGSELTLQSILFLKEDLVILYNFYPEVRVSNKVRYQ